MKTSLDADASLEERSDAVTANPADDALPQIKDREASENTPPVTPDFSLVLGGPLFQLYRRTHLSGSALELLHRRLVAIPLFAWLPLLLLSALDGHALGAGLRIPFLYDFAANVRFLVALPVLILAELLVHKRISPLARRFVQRRIVETDDLPRFHAAINSAQRGRNSAALEGILLVLVYTIGLLIWRSQTALGEPTWYATPAPKQLHLTTAGYWYVFVSVPVFQFILLRWYLRLAIWFRFLWQVSKLNLHLSAAHPDRAGGIGFLGKSSYAFGPVLFAQGAILAGLIGNRVVYEGRALLSFKMEAVGLVSFFVLVILGPLVMFSSQLSSARRKGSAEYGLLATRYVFDFEDKWIKAGRPAISELVATGDIQSLADLESVYANVREMRVVPFGADDIARLAVTTAAPLLPLLLTIYSAAELAKLLIKVLFR